MLHLKQLRDAGNSVIVVEHDKEMILSADHVIDMGPGAGRHGGLVVAHGNPEELMKQDTLTSSYLNNKKKFNIPEERRKGNGKFLILTGASGHNLNNVDVDIASWNIYLCNRSFGKRKIITY